MATVTDSRSWIDLLQIRAEEKSEQQALVYIGTQSGERPISYAALDAWARSIGSQIQRQVRPSDRVLIMLPSDLHYVAAFFGALYAGCIPVTAYPLRHGRQLGRARGIIADCQPAILIAEQGAVAMLAESRAQLNFTGSILDVETLSVTPSTQDFVPHRGKRDDIAFLQYTSGSTSVPKGVMVSHDNLFHNCRLLMDGMGFNADSVVGSWLPLYHDMGLIGKILCSLYAGVPCYFMSPADFARSPYLWLKLISDNRCTISGAPNFAYDLCIKKISETEKTTLDLSCWEVAWNGAESVRRKTLDEFHHAFSMTGLRKSSLHPCYGLAEATLFVTAQALGTEPVSQNIDIALLGQGQFKPSSLPDARAVEYVSVGSPRADTLVKIVDPETAEICAEGQIGELWTSSPSVALGYWQNAEASKHTFGARLASDPVNRYLRTGDLGVQYNGQIYITGRLKDVFICNGRNIYPQDIESSIDYADERIVRSAVFSITGKDQISQAVAVCEVAKGVEKQPSHQLDQLCLNISAAVQSEHEFQLAEVILVAFGTIPRTTSGKVQRAATRLASQDDKLKLVHGWKPLTLGGNKHTEIEPIQVPALPDGLLPLLRDQLARLLNAPVESIRSTHRIAELGLSSLQLHELLFVLEAKLQRTVEVQSLYTNNPTLEDIASRLTEQGSGSEAYADSSSTYHPVQLVAQKYQQKVHNSEHAFIRAMNPEFGRKLSQLRLDKEFVRADGLHLYDEDGNEYLDFLSQYGALPFGHNHPQIWEAILDFHKQSLPAMVQPSFQHLASRLAVRLAELAPGDIAYTTFCNSGAEAIEAAIKLSRSTTGRKKILATVNGFHGKTLGALSATGREKYRKHFAVSEDFHHVPFNDLTALEQALLTREYAGFIVEPIQGEAGIIMPQPGYLQKAQALCREHGTVFVVDEVQTGLGRTGSMFYSDQLELSPDVITLAKGLGGGLMPIGACLASSRVYNDEFATRHTSTFAGNGLACAVGLKALDLLSADDGALMRQVREIGTRLKRALLDLQRKYPQLIRDVRGTGLMLGVHIDIDRYRFGSGLLASVSEEEFLTSLLMSYLLNHEHVRLAFTLNNGNVLRIQPPLTVTWVECQRVLEALDNTLGVLATRNMGQMIGHLVGLSRPEIPSSPTYTVDFLKPSITNGARGFGFLLHPLTSQTYADFDISLQRFDDQQLQHIGKVFGDNFEPFLGGENQLMSDTGDMITGQFWVVPRTASDLVKMPQAQALLEVQQAMDKAVAEGARIVGLGAYTSTVTQGGLLLQTPPGVHITTGNTFTALVGFLSIVRALGRPGMTLRECSIAIVGATGAIGRAMALLLAPLVRRLYLIGNPASSSASMTRMIQIGEEIVAGRHDLSQTFAFAKGPLQSQIELLGRAESLRDRVLALEQSGALVLTSDWSEGLPHADVIVTATNSPDAAIGPDQPAQGAIICDISRPSNVSRDMATQRPDVFVYDGGVVQLPQGSELGMHTDLEKGLCYACMAETMLIALEDSLTLASLGTDIRMTDIAIYQSLARKHGFEVHVPSREHAFVPAYRQTLA
ncbi:aminotransferase class III-fold pyridoxal phosphate-dependent enzyme [Allohahella sp. A8]|uniref:aminotransferase class III-fold pyridoxal phosphate-dependent enzyme n=1 Tax=Allohahella sp. A8 TaxID=3141461 RepID=UPI003A801CD0